MAHATAQTERVPVTTYVEEKRVILNLSEEEAKHLCALLGAFGGLSETRKVLTYGEKSIPAALREAGVFARLLDSDGYNYTISIPQTTRIVSE